MIINYYYFTFPIHVPLHTSQPHQGLHLYPHEDPAKINIS